MTKLVPRISLILAIIAIILVTACSRHRDPQAVFDHASRAFRSGDMTAAAEEAAKGRKEFHSAGADWAWKFTLLEATALNREGMYDQALKLLAAEPNAPASGDLAVKKRWTEGIAYTSLRKFPDAEKTFRETEPLCEASKSSACGDVASARGTLEMEEGHYAEAQIFFERVLAAARASGDQIWESAALLDLSWCANEQTHFDEALDWANAARQIALSKGPADIAQKALGNMGWAYYKLGDLEKAESMFAEAGSQAEKLGEVASEAGWLTNAGYAQMDASALSLARESFQQSLALARKIKSPADIMDSLTALSFVSEQSGTVDDAKRYADEALAMARGGGNGRDVVYPLLVEGRIAARQHDTAAAQTAFQQVKQSADTPVFLRWEAERSLARLYEEEKRSDAAGREYQTALSTFETARSELKREDSRLPFLSNASRLYDDYIHFLVARGKTAEALQVADYSRGRTLSEGLGLLPKDTSFKPDRVDAPAIARRANSTVLFYWLGEQSSFLWAISPIKVGLFPLPASAEIEAAVERYRKALNGPEDVLTTANDDARSLYRILIAPARPMLPENAKVIIIPDGKLNTLNFETLLVSAPTPHYWIEDVTIEHASSLRLLAAAHKGKGKEKRGRNLLLFGNTVAPSQEYPELANAAAEMASIEKHFPAAQQQVFQRGQATVAAYLASKPEQFSYIHFVAHGMASRLSPLESAIVLSKNGGDNENFKLYARDIIQHPVRAELVTISACYGAGTRAYSGEGLVGLSWAFLRAGAENVVAALWDASDVSTAQLMDKFYEELDKGASPGTALRTAKLSLLHSESAFHKPFYWAPFQLYAGS
jgi:CHAT domain-containing protein